MDLLPRHHDEFNQVDYWDKFFRKRGKSAFEWYGEYGQLCGILHKYIKIKDKLLIVGCGNSSLSADLYDVGYKSIQNIDLSEVVVRQMKAFHESVRPGLEFFKMDVTCMTFEDSTFNCVLDKGTLDALFTSEKEVDTTNKMFSEIDRILRLGGRYVCISLLQPHILKYLVFWFSERGWPLRIVRCKEAEESRKLEDRVFPVFAVIATKFNKALNTMKILEMSLSSSGQTTRLPSEMDLINSVRGIQQFAAIRAGVSKSKSSRDDEFVSLDLRTAGSESPKYSLFLVELDKDCFMKFAVFIVPQGREMEWLFSTPEGRKQLAESANCSRLVVAHLCRDHSFTSLKNCQDELSGFVMELAPPNLPPNMQVPFLSIGNDSIGERVEKCRGKSDFSGEYVVEDVEVNGDEFRRLTFLNNPNLTQSEAKLKIVKIKGKKKKVVDRTFLSCTHHSVMIGSLGLFSFADSLKCLLVGLGGGALAVYVTSTFANVELDVVEIDPIIARVAEEQFECRFKESDRLKVILQDGVKFIDSFSVLDENEKYKIVMFDVDAKNTSTGIGCPPLAFLEREFLVNMKKNCLHSSGVFVLNMVCRNTSIRENVMKLLKELFQDVLSYRVPEEVNEILFCSNNIRANKKMIDKNHPIVDAFQKVNHKVNLFDMHESMKQLNVE